MDFVFFLKQSAHCEVKVFASRAVDPARAENQVFAAGALDVDVAGKFGFPVDVERVWLVVFRPRFFFRAVEDVVGGVVDHECVVFRGPVGHYAGGVGVEFEGELAFCFRLVHGSVGGGVGYHRRLELVESVYYRGFISQVAFVYVDGLDFSERRERAAEFPTDLSVFAEYQYS